MKLKHTFLTLLLGLATLATSAQVPLVKNQKPVARIVLTTDTETDKTAGELLQTFVERISGATLPIVSAQTLKKGDIGIGNGGSNASYVSAELTEDGFGLSTGDGILRIVSGGDKGSIYGVVTLLEQYLGVNYWSENECSFPRRKDITLPDLSLTQNPAFRYRQSQNYAMGTDPVYKLWMRLEEPREVFAGGYWVHTFDALLPSAVYGKDHPEYYSYFKGKRHPGKASQWCLTNPDVLEIVSQRLDSIFKANPDKHIISVSQNDGNYTNCTCDACKALDEHEGALSGSLIHFMNKLAERFPDKEFSTLAYLYTMKPPKHVKPLPNVNIMLCDIDCTREVSLTENASGREFVEAMEGWSRISNNIFVWDYGINFDNYVSPFPNFHILQDNIRLFRQNNVTMHFSQIAGSRGGDFAEMRTWMVSKLMWNPEADTDSLMKVFLSGYYGPAAPELYQYVKMMEGALISSRIGLWIYDSPVTHKNGMLNPLLMKRYNALFDRAEAKTQNMRPLSSQDIPKDLDGDSRDKNVPAGYHPALPFPDGSGNIYQSRVRRTRLPLQYAELEIARTEKGNDLAELNAKLALFEERVKAFNVPTLNERNNSPVDYCQLYRTRFMPRPVKSLASGATVSFGVEPSGRYAELGKTALTDELFGGATFVESWVGWEGIDGDLVIDLGEEKEIQEIDTDFLHQLGQWILLPTKVVYSLSSDGKTFTEAGTYDLPEDRSSQVKYVSVKHTAPAPVKTRYIKIDVTGTKVCPEWHYGVGHPCWFFIDEVTVL